MTKHFAIKIYCQVQGVFCRQSARQIADALHVTGFARNEPDGSVYIEIEGEAENLKQFIAWCHQGSKFTKVDKVEIKELR